AHRDFRDKQDRIDEQHTRQPLPANELVRHEGVGNPRRYKTAEGDHRDRLQVRVRTHDRGDRIEDAVEAVVIAVSVDLVHTRTLAYPLACSHRKTVDRKSTRLNSSHVAISYA